MGCRGVGLLIDRPSTRDTEMSSLVRRPCEEGMVDAEAAQRCREALAPWILVATILGSGMAFVDGTVVNLALPKLQETMGATVTEAQWVVESYALVLACSLLVGGALGDKLGRRRIFMHGVGLFALSSAFCGLASTPEFLITARGFQGAGAALLVPGSLSIIGASFDQSKRGKAIGIWSSCSAISAAMGLVVGGWIIDVVSWRLIFVINLPIAGAVLLITGRFVPESRAQEDRNQAIDWLSVLLAVLGLGLVVFGLIESSSLGWRHWGVWLAIGPGIVSLFLFTNRQRRIVNPMVPPTLFHSRAFTGANLVTLLVYGALGGSLFFLPLNLVQVQGYSATAAGAAYLPLIILVSLLSSRAGGWSDRIGAKPLLIAGPLTTGLGFGLIGVPGVGGSYWTTFFPGISLVGLGMAITVAPLTTTVMNAVDPGQVGLASGINNAASRVAGVLAIALFGPLMVAIYSTVLERKLEPIGLDSGIQGSILEQRTLLAATEIPTGLDPEVTATVRLAIQSAFIAGFRAVTVTAVLLCLSAATVSTTLTRRR